MVGWAACRADTGNRERFLPPPTPAPARGGDPRTPPPSRPFRRHGVDRLLSARRSGVESGVCQDTTGRFMALHRSQTGNGSPRDPHGSEKHIPPSRRIFVNRNLKMESIRMIGFDMDHTLAVYQKLPLETLAFEATRDKLITEHHYPESVRNLRYDPDLIIRGLVVDKRLGNILKIDQYHYVVRVCHGTRRLSKEERRRLYRNSRIRLSSDKYMSVDTLFSLPEATLFAQLVDHFESEGRPRRDYTQVYDDVRECIDRAHADGSIKERIMAAPERFLLRQPDLAAVLEAFRDHGKRLFLLTNSEAHYTHRVMSHLLDGARESYPRWYNYFDVVVVNARKPSFFRNFEPVRRLPPAEVVQAGLEPETAILHEGGGTRAFEKMVGFRGDEILYVGDHTFVDILRAKETSRWRTAMVIEELEQEIEREQEVAARYRDLDELVANRARVMAQIGRVQRRLSVLRREGRNGAPGTAPAADRVVDPLQELEQRVQRLEEQSARLAAAVRERREQIESCFNPNWGKLCKCGEINSRFGDQVKDFACIYTSAVRNFLTYPPSTYFRSPRELMPHEMGLDQG
jgi:HAD superfamily 5'-nucleotidase-like hydrolase